MLPEKGIIEGINAGLLSYLIDLTDLLNADIKFPLQRL
jgi:hypothetical protein